MNKKYEEALAKFDQSETKKKMKSWKNLQNVNQNIKK